MNIMSIEELRRNINKIVVSEYADIPVVERKLIRLCNGLKDL